MIPSLQKENTHISDLATMKVFDIQNNTNGIVTQLKSEIKLHKNKLKKSLQNTKEREELLEREKSEILGL